MWTIITNFSALLPIGLLLKHQMHGFAAVFAASAYYSCLYHQSCEMDFQWSDELFAVAVGTCYGFFTTEVLRRKGPTPLVYYSVLLMIAALNTFVVACIWPQTYCLMHALWHLFANLSLFAMIAALVC